MLSYSFHISSKKNAINTKSDLLRVSCHNSRNYSEVQENNLEMNLELSKENIFLKGTDNPYQDVKNFYNDFFEESRVKYNQNQTREDRKIYDYFEKISNDTKKQMAVEIIIQLGDKKFWENKSIEERKQMDKVFQEQIKFLEDKLPNFKICNAVVHHDEASPHLQILGVPIAEKNKNGMDKQVSKKVVFTKEVLQELQASMRENAIENFNEFYKTKEILKQTEKGRNKDYLVDEIKEIKKLEEEKEKLILEIEAKKENLKEIAELEKFIEANYSENSLEYLKQKKEDIIKMNEKFQEIKSSTLETNLRLDIYELEQKKEKLVAEDKKQTENEINKLTSLDKDCQEVVEMLKAKASQGEAMFGGYKFSYDELNQVYKTLNSKSEDYKASKIIYDRNLLLEKEINLYKKRDSFSSEFNLTQLKDELLKVKKENVKNAKILNVIFEKYPKVKEIWNKLENILYPAKENIWEKKLKKEKEAKKEKEINL